MTIDQSKPWRGARATSSATESSSFGSSDRRGSEPGRRVPPLAGRVDRHDLRRAPHARALDRVDAHAAAADHAAAASRLDAQRLDRRAHTGDHGAADDGGHVGRHVVGEREHAALRHDGVLGEAAEKGIRRDDARRARDRAGPGRQPALAHGVESLLTQDRAPDEAVRAATATGRHVEQHAAARRYRRHPRPDCLDDARTLVAEHRRQREAPLAVGLADVRVADPRAHDSHEHLAGPGIAQQHVLDRVGLAEGTEDGSSGLHGGLRHRRIEPVRPLPHPPTGNLTPTLTGSLTSASD